MYSSESKFKTTNCPHCIYTYVSLSETIDEIPAVAIYEGHSDKVNFSMADREYLTSTIFPTFR